ncbi:hypothetical protein ANO11243_042450 [Dothideomycetidae sp. 11243]|nr:hypothetical protein ANO11243_042450 [fungal sp. No.11243]
MIVAIRHSWLSKYSWPTALVIILLWHFTSRKQSNSTQIQYDGSHMKQTECSFDEIKHDMSFHHGKSTHRHKSTKDTRLIKNTQLDVDLVLASVKRTNTSWLDTALPSFHHKVYVVDDESAALTVPLNKGNEAMVYLTHIINNYDNLAAVTVFVHADRYQWHNDDPDYDNARILGRLNTAGVQEQGYVNLRCAWQFGCDTDLLPLRSRDEYQTALKADANYRPGFEQVYASAFEALMPGRTVPHFVQVACCAQFAASRDAILSHSKEDYIRYQKWIMDSEYDNGITGRVFEFLWHMILGKTAMSCPTAESCYCDNYGICDLKCENEGDCRTYKFPPDGAGQEFPSGWPEIGFDGEAREISADRI